MREAFMWEGNDCVDKEAKEAVNGHWDNDDDKVKWENWRDENKEVAQICKVIGKTLACFPRLGRTCTSGRKSGRTLGKFGQRNVDVDHSWLYVKGLWRCRQCGHFKYGDERTVMDAGCCPGLEKRAECEVLASEEFA